MSVIWPDARQAMKVGLSAENEWLNDYQFSFEMN